MNCGYEIKWSYDPRSYERNFCNCVKKPEKFRTLTGFEPVTSRYRCDALTNWTMKPLMLGNGHLWVPGNVPVRNESTMTYHFIVDSFLMGTLEPRNDQLPKLEMSTNFEFELHMDSKSGSPQTPPPPFPLLFWSRMFFFSFVNVCRMVLRAFLLKYIVFTKHC